jgi:signal transduction histidine kinase
MEADFTKLHILFSNVLDNAFQSMKSMAGTLTVGIRRQGAEAWEISIADTGTGIDEKDMGKIFEPFYTTKSKGTGLGLAICSEIVYVHGGSIKVHSVKGQGTTFTIILPAKQPASNKDTPQP